MSHLVGDEYSWCVLSDESDDPDACVYRYELGRSWAPSLGLLVFVMLNPSKADHKKPDMTITKCAGFTRQNNHGGFIVVNMYGLRATNPMMLLEAKDPIGPENDAHVWSAISRSARHGVVAAWGGPPTNHPMFVERFRKIEGMYSPWRCLGVTQTGRPRHPSRLGYQTPLVDLREARIR